MALVKVIVDGQTVEIEEGTPLIEACFEAGKEVPHFCYHTGLSVSGNCRMCAVHLTNAQFPDKPYPMACLVPARTYKDREGNESPMEVVTQSDELTKMRRDIMEFLLINHPLDCPQCDQAGECVLQNYAYTWGPDRSRFDEQKVIRHIKPLGPEVSIWGTRCIACDRCARFCNEITGTGELTLVNRGDRSVIDVHPDHPLDNPMSLCTVDLCPVGALLSTDFLYKARVWFLEPADHICGTCSSGCNMHLDAFDGEVKRLRPRDNMEVNQYWACDAGRLEYKYQTSESRIRHHRLKGEEVDVRTGVRSAIDAVAGLSGKAGETALVGTAWMTNEELFLFGELAAKLGVAESRRFIRKRPDGDAWVSKSGWRIEADRNPNHEGVARLLGIDESSDTLDELAALIEGGDVKHVVWIGAIPDHEPGEKLVAASGKLDTLVMVDALEHALTAKATHLVAGSVWLEKDGTVISRVRHGHGDPPATPRIQRTRTTAHRPEDARDDAEILQRFIAGIDGEKPSLQTPARLFTRLAERCADFDGLTLGAVGAQGVAIGSGRAVGA